MSDRHIASRFQSLRLRNAWSAFDFTRSGGVGASRRANENAVSAASDRRVTDGAAPLAAMSRMAVRPAVHVGKTEPRILRSGGTRRTWIVASVITPSLPSLP